MPKVALQNKMKEHKHYPIDIHGNEIKDWKTTVGVTYWPGYGNVPHETNSNFVKIKKRRKFVCIK